MYIYNFLFVSILEVSEALGLGHATLFILTLHNVRSYFFLGFTANSSFCLCCCLQICRLQQHLSAGEHQQDLFRDQPPIFVSSLSQPPCASLTELIQLCGGAVCRGVRQASICIGKYKGKKPEGTKCLSEQWILGKRSSVWVYLDT